MREAVRRHAATIVVAAVVAALTAAAPSIAAGVRATFASNADRVDGIHAIAAATAKASSKARRGVLVATDPKTGLLPGAVIPAIPGSKVAVASLPSVPTADVATTAENASRVGGYTPAQLTLTKVDAVDSAATLNTAPVATVSFTAPAAGYVTWSATCQFVSTLGAPVQADLKTTVDHGGDGTDREYSHFVDVPSTFFNIQALGVTDWEPVPAGETIVVGMAPTASSNAANLRCANGRLVATYSATTTEG